MKNSPTRAMITPACSTNAVSRSETSPCAAAWPSATSAAAQKSVPTAAYDPISVV